MHIPQEFIGIRIPSPRGIAYRIPKADSVFFLIRSIRLIFEGLGEKKSIVIFKV